MNQLKEIGGLSKMLSSSLEASKNAQEEYQNKVIQLLTDIYCECSNTFTDAHNIYDEIVEIRNRMKLLDECCPGHYRSDCIHCKVCEFNKRCQDED